VERLCLAAPATPGRVMARRPMCDTLIVFIVTIAASSGARLGTGKSPRTISLFVAVALLVLLVPLGTGASAAFPTVKVEGCKPPLIGPVRYSLWVSACGPAHVIRNTNYTYGVVVKNFGKASLRKIKLSVIHYDPITRSSIRYRRAYRTDYREHAAVWTLHDFKPGRLFRVNITLPFKQHNDPKGSNFTVEARGYGPSEVRDRTKDVVFTR